MPVVTDAADGWASAWVDFNNDGLLDLFVSGFSGQNRLYRNDGSGVFTPITTGAIQGASGAYSASWVDIDNDGRDDLFLGPRDGSPGSLFFQQPDGTFKQTPLPKRSGSLGAAWGDYDNDGYVDLRIGDPTINLLWHNDGHGNLVPLNTGPSVGSNAGQITRIDFDQDGYSDLVISSSAGSDTPCRLFRNNGNGLFTEVIGAFPGSTYSTGMAWGDYDNDGFPDVFICRLNSDFSTQLASMLFHNNGDGTFKQIQQSPFKDELGFAGACAWGDYDNDGWLDLIVSNFGSNARNRLYHNNGDGTFTRITTGPGGDGSGSSAGVIWGDYDRDGFLDLFVANTTGEGSEPNDYLYHNNGNSNAWITIKCVGSRSNRSGIGAKVRVKATIDGRAFWQMREINTGHGLAQSAIEAHFGLSNATNVETLRIEWPSGTVQEFSSEAAKHYLTGTEPARLAVTRTNGVPQLTLQGGRNLQYDIQHSSDLKTWSPLGNATITNLDGTYSNTITNALTSGSTFYRAELQ